MDTNSVHPEGPDDTIDAHYSGLERLERLELLAILKAPCGCYDGFVYIGHMVTDESGEEVEVFESVPCRRCNR